MTNFQLPGAKNFSAYLEGLNCGVWTASEPETIDWSYGIDYTKRQIVRLNGEQIGEYFTFGPKPGEPDFARVFKGRIPGYVNECVAVGDKSKKMPENTVSLIYDNKAFEAQSMREGPGRLVDTLWQRQDGHDRIPFP